MRVSKVVVTRENTENRIKYRVEFAPLESPKELFFMSDVNLEAQPETMSADRDEALPSALESLKPRSGVMGKVTRIDLGGVFVDIGVGVDGFAHISQLLVNDEPVTRVADVFKPGDEIQVYVKNIVPSKKRVDLTMHRPATYDWSNIPLNGTLHNVKVVSVENFGAFVDFDGPKHGLVPFNLMPRDFHPKVGDNIETVWVIEVNEQKRRVGMTMVEPPALPWEQIQRGKEYKGKVTRIERIGAYVDIGAEREGLIRASSLGGGFVDMRSVVSEGEEIVVKAIKVDPNLKRIDFAIQGLNPEEFSLSSGPEETISPFAAALQRAQKVKRAQERMAANKK
jgi:ribosomal protein S1